MGEKKLLCISPKPCDGERMKHFEGGMQAVKPLNEKKASPQWRTPGCHQKMRQVVACTLRSISVFVLGCGFIDAYYLIKYNQLTD